MVKRNWLEQIGGFDDVHDVIDDWDAWLRLSYAGCEMDWLEEPVCEYRIHETNMIRNTVKLRDRRLAMLGYFFAQNDLPEHLVSLKLKAVALTHLQASCLEYGLGLVAEAQTDLARAMNLEPDLLSNGGDYILQVLCDQAQRPLFHDSTAVVNCALANLPPEAAGLPRIQQRGRARLALSRSFKAAQQEDWITVRRVLPEALVDDPKWILNRGVWSLGATALLGPAFMNWARVFLHRGRRPAKTSQGASTKMNGECTNGEQN